MSRKSGHRFSAQGHAPTQESFPYLAVDTVSKQFGGLRALHDCSFEIHPGRITCLMGPNGAGKTSVFNVITGFIRPDSGTVRFKDADLLSLSRRQIVARGIARTFQNLRLFDELTTIDNVMVCLKDEAGNSALAAMCRPLWTRAVLRAKTEVCAAYLTQVGLGHKLNDPVRNLSFGQQKLLAIARLLATEAELLLLDEPTAGLGQTALQEMVDLVHKLKEAGKTLLVVEHNTRVVEKIADEVLFLHQGQLIARGRTEEITADKRLTDIYFGGAI
jgi:branched-chain amino acid transport system ATP-binding protein